MPQWVSPVCDLLKTRRGVRSYTGERVPREMLEWIARGRPLERLDTVSADSRVQIR